MVGHQYVQNITVDLGGHTLSSTAIALTSYRSGSTLTIKNGTVKGNSSSGTLRATYGGRIILGDDLTVQGAGGGATLIYVDNGTVDIAAKNGVNFVGGKQDLKKSSDNDNNKLNIQAAIERTYFGTLADAINSSNGSDQEIVVLENITLPVDTTIVIDKPVVLNLNGKIIDGENTRTATHNFLFDVKGGTLTASNGTIAMKHTGAEMGWNGATTVIDVTAGGVLNLNDVTVQNQGGTDMNFAVHLNNWGEVTLNADKCVFDATYCGVRVFNSGYDMNNVTITNSKLTGATRAFWVHNYIGDLDSTKHSNEAIKARLNLNIYNNNNTFEITGEAKSPIRYGFGTSVYFNAEGSRVVDSADALQDAIAAAGANDIITLQSDIKLDEKNLITVDGYNTFFKISNKEVTIDLNGKTIYADASGVTKEDGFVVGVFFAYNGGKLTLMDSSKDKTGTVQGYSGATQSEAYLDPEKGNKDYNYKFYCLLASYDDDTSIVVNGGNYILDYAGDSIAYSSGNEGVTVNGGTFKVGNLGGIRNGMPWVFNARGQNIRHVVVNGGSFCADIQHQYYPFEVNVPRNLALSKTDDGMYTVVPAVAYVTEREWSSAWYTNEIGYATLEEAIEACEGPKKKGNNVSDQEIVVLLTDITLPVNTTLTITKTVVIDLQSNSKQHTIYGENTNTATHNFLIDVKGGSLTVMNGTISMKHTGNNMGWNGATTVIDVTAGGVLNLYRTKVENLGGTDMNFAVHLNNWGKVSLYAENCSFIAPYCGVRVFNSGFDTNTVDIKNSTFTGATRAFWVHNYIGDLDSTKHPDAAIRDRLKIDIYGNKNTFKISGEAKSPIRYGFGTSVYFDPETGYQIVDNAQDLQDAINNGSSEIILGGDIDLSQGIIIP